ncbi:MAG: SCO family protein [Marinicella sp.]|nr:SCO family protein [Xanthomonadales bacterium]
MSSIKSPVLLLMLASLLTACDQNPTASNQAAKFQSLKLFPEGKSFSGFELISDEGNKWQSEDFKGNYSVLFFGYANCPDICPTTLLDMQKVDKALTTAGIKTPEIIFISVDPDRDTPAVLHDYINYFNPKFTALTGDAANILSLASQLGVAYRVAEHEKGDMMYEVDHASALFVLNPEGERIGIFAAPHDVNKITADLKQLMEQS